VAQEFDTIDNGSIAVITVSGTMTKRGSSFGGGGMLRSRRQIRAAENDGSVRGILIRFDTPGGTVAGTADLAADVAGTTKPTIGFVEDLCASAGYWVASQCDEVFANTSTALVGSIGTFMAVHDISAALNEEKIRTIVVKAGEFKAGGFPGTEITDEQVAEWQKMINGTQKQFTAGIAAGRGMTTAQAGQLVTGLVYLAEEAQQLGLIDGIKTFDSVVERLRSQTLAGAAKMADEKEPIAATYAEIVAACPGIDTKQSADALFVAEAQEAGLTAKDAGALYCDSLRERLDASSKREAELSEEVNELKSAATQKPPGVPAVGTKTADPEAGDPITEFKSMVSEQMKAGAKTKADAVRAVNKLRPELREAMLAAHAQNN